MKTLLKSVAFGLLAPGAYPVTVYGRPALAVLANRFGFMGGRVALLTDPDALAHVIDPAAWM